MDSFFQALNHILYLLREFLAKMKQENYENDTKSIKDDPLGYLGNESARVRDISEFVDSEASNVRETDDN